MKVIIFAIFVTFVAGCAEFGVDYYGSDITSVGSVSTWQDCARHCQNLPKCQYWTWTFVVESYYYKRCYLKTSNNGRRRGNTISGKFDCLED